MREPTLERSRIHVISAGRVLHIQTLLDYISLLILEKDGITVINAIKHLLRQCA